MVVMMLAPRLRLTAPLAVPEVTALPLTVSVAVASSAVGVSFRLVTPLGTLRV